MSPTDRIDYSVQNQVAVIAMNRPPINAIDHAMIEAVHTALRQAEADTAVRAVILTSTLPGMFCGGMDLRMIAQGDVQNLRAFVNELERNKQFLVMKTVSFQMQEDKGGEGGGARSRGRTSLGSGLVLAVEASVYFQP